MKALILRRFTMRRREARPVRGDVGRRDGAIFLLSRAGTRWEPATPAPWSCGLLIASSLAIWSISPAVAVEAAASANSAGSPAKVHGESAAHGHKGAKGAGGGEGHLAGRAKAGDVGANARSVAPGGERGARSLTARHGHPAPLTTARGVTASTSPNLEAARGAANRGLEAARGVPNRGAFAAPNDGHPHAPRPVLQRQAPASATVSARNTGQISGSGFGKGKADSAIRPLAKRGAAIDGTAVTGTKR
jgi:hypothetical protein